MNYLKDADWRLTKAQTFLERSYGRDQGRLMAIKGGICPEMVVFCRMLILRGILAFHQGQLAAARYALFRLIIVHSDFSLPLLGLGLSRQRRG